MIALRRENADLEQPVSRHGRSCRWPWPVPKRQSSRLPRGLPVPEVPVQAPTPEPPEEAVACCARPAAQPAAQPEPVWQPETELEKLSVELLAPVCEMMQE